MSKRMRSGSIKNRWITGSMLFMILPLCLIFHINTAYQHQHTLPDGSIIEHAHPYRSDNDNPNDREGHQHTEKELILYTLISGSPVVSASLYQLPDAHRLIELEFKIGRAQQLKPDEFVNPCSSRAPPAISLFS